MKIITMNEELGLIWYTARDWQQRDMHVVCYGLQVKQFSTRQDAQAEFTACLNHAWECAGE